VTLAQAAEYPIISLPSADRAWLFTAMSGDDSKKRKKT